MVMEASPSPQSVGREFVRQYYTLLNKAPAHLHRFYNNYSSFVHGGLDAPNRETLPVVGQKQIHNRIQQLNFRDCHAKISQVDAQATLGSGVVVQVTGELSNGGAPMRRFTQTFVLAAQSPKKYYVHNDIFRYQDVVLSDEEVEEERSEGEEDEQPVQANTSAGYFPPPPQAFPAPFNQQPQPPATAPPAPASPALNGHPPLAPVATAHTPVHQPTAHQPPAHQPTAHQPSLAQGHAQGHPVQEEVRPRSPPRSPPASSPPPSVDPAAELSPPPAAPASPPPAAPAAPVAPEPKTYANLLKSGVRASPPQQPPPFATRMREPPTTEIFQAPPPPASAPVRRAERADRADRADRAEPPPPPRRYSDAQQLFLGNLPHCATEDELRALFGRFGAVAELRVHCKQAAGQRHPNYGFITYESAQAAHDCLNAAPLYFPPDSADGVKLNVEEKKARGREPPRRRPPSGQRQDRPDRPDRDRPERERSDRDRDRPDRPDRGDRPERERPDRDRGDRPAPFRPGAYRR